VTVNKKSNRTPLLYIPLLYIILLIAPYPISWALAQSELFHNYTYTIIHASSHPQLFHNCTCSDCGAPYYNLLLGLFTASNLLNIRGFASQLLNCLHILYSNYGDVNASLEGELICLGTDDFCGS